MPPPDFGLGDAFKFNENAFVNTRGFDYHPHFIINTPSKHDGLLLCVNATSWVSTGDSTCRLAVGDHSLIDRDCYIIYAFPKVFPSDIFKKWYFDNYLNDHGQITPALLQRIEQGARTSVHFQIKKFGHLLD